MQWLFTGLSRGSSKSGYYDEFISSVIWVKVFKNGPSKIYGRQFLKAVFHKFYLVHSWIPWTIAIIPNHLLHLGRLIQTNSGAREHLLFEIPSGTRKTMGTDAVIRMDWSTFTAVIGPCVKGKLFWFSCLNRFFCV